MPGVLTRWQIRWTGAGINGAAATTLHYAFDGGEPDGAALATHAVGMQGAISDGIRAIIPSAVSLAVSSEVQVLDVDTGMITGILSPSNGTAAMGGGGTGPFSSASGAVISLGTPGVTRGRRIKGRLFIVPLAGSAYDTDGTLSAGALGSLQTSGNELLRPAGSTASLVVYSRPPKGATTGGLVHVVTAATVRDKVAILRSRRD